MSKNVTVPVAVAGVTVADKLTGLTGGSGFGLTETAIAEVELDAAPMMMFGPLLTAVESWDVATLNVELG